MIDVDVVFLHTPDSVKEPQVVSVGTFSIPASFKIEGGFRGRWRLNAARNANVEGPLAHDYVAPLAGLGELTSRCDGAECVLELYPGVIDNNIEIVLSRSLLGEGRWQYVTDAGVSASGIVHVSSPSN